MAITLRATKGSALTHNELDANFTDLVAVDTATDAAVTAVEARATALEVVKYTHGIEDHNGTDAAIALASGVKTKMLCNGLGTFTNTTYKIPGRGDIWNTSTNAFDFLNAGLALGDTVTIRMDMNITTSANNNGVVVELDLGTGGGLYSLAVGSHDWRTAGTYHITVISEIYMGDTNTLNNPGTIHVTSDTAGDSVAYNGHYIKYGLRNASAT